MSRTYRKCKISKRFKNLESFETYCRNLHFRYANCGNRWMEKYAEDYEIGVDRTREWFSMFRDGGLNNKNRYFYPVDLIVKHRQRRQDTKKYLREVKKDIDRWYESGLEDESKYQYKDYWY